MAKEEYPLSFLLGSRQTQLRGKDTWIQCDVTGRDSLITTWPAAAELEIRIETNQQRNERVFFFFLSMWCESVRVNVLVDTKRELSNVVFLMDFWTFSGLLCSYVVFFRRKTRRGGCISFFFLSLDWAFSSYLEAIPGLPPAPSWPRSPFVTSLPSFFRAFSFFFSFLSSRFFFSYLSLISSFFFTFKISLFVSSYFFSISSAGPHNYHWQKGLPSLSRLSFTFPSKGKILDKVIIHTHRLSVVAADRLDRPNYRLVYQQLHQPFFTQDTQQRSRVRNRASDDFLRPTSATIQLPPTPTPRITRNQKSAGARKIVAQHPH